MRAAVIDADAEHEKGLTPAIVQGMRRRRVLTWPTYEPAVPGHILPEKGLTRFCPVLAGAVA